MIVMRPMPLFADLSVLPDYTLVRSRRRTIAIHVHDGRVEVRAPMRVAQRDVDAFVREKSLWIAKKLQELRSRDNDILRLFPGNIVTVMGETLTVHWQVAARGVVRSENGCLFISGAELDERQARHLFLQWLLRQAEVILLPMAERRVAEMRLSDRLSGFSLRYTRSLWGRCSARGNILFNPLILLAPPAVIDYLVVHEACHLRHMNHSAAFWALVAEYCPEWKLSRDWLKTHGHSLRIG